MSPKKLLKEGGVGGHMNHLYDDPDMTFEKLESILTAASDGELEPGTEKTDGQNLYVSYSLRSGQAVAARVPKDMVNQGLDIAGLAKKFSTHASRTVEAAFNDSFAAFTETVSKFPLEAIKIIFGKDANIFYNAEVMDPRNPNIVMYDRPRLLIQQGTHYIIEETVDEETGEVTYTSPPAQPYTGSAMQKSMDALQRALNNSAAAENEKAFSVEINAYFTLKALSDDVALNKAKKELEAIRQEANVPSSATMQEYLFSRIKIQVEGLFPGMPGANKIAFVKRILGISGSNIKNVKRGLSRELLAQIPSGKSLGQLIRKMKKEAIRPVEKVVHEFSVEMIRTLKSLYILDKEQANQVRGFQEKYIQIRDEILPNLEAHPVVGQYPDAIDNLKKQIEKIGFAENISTAAEGFVFSVDGKMYKFTGNFAPFNQILGMFEYGRGGMPALKDVFSDLNEALDIPMEEDLTEEGEDYVILAVGGFKPPHKGHYKMVEHYKNHPNVAKVIVIMGSTPRPDKEADREEQALVSFEQAIKIWSLYGIHPGATGGNGGDSYDGEKVEFLPFEGGSPIRYVYGHLMEEGSSFLNTYEGYRIAFGAGDKPGDDKRAHLFVNHYMRNGMPDGVEVTLPPDFCPACKSLSGENLSATEFRKAIKSEDINRIKEFLPAHKNDDGTAQTIIDIINDYSDKEFELDKDEKSQVFEMSSMAAGNVSGFSGPVKKKRKKKKRKNLEEWLLDNVYDYLLKESSTRQVK
jgi:hypothetical protein